ncbi:hypothetical protein SOM10_02140 [Microbacterium sp. CFBP9023]|uniref:hypothetical protein n=1 Tax=Microbacterium sp. CFBP9023 TaxID=3096535 RepID=UPI002A6A1396|nr:hypothetical protein [Microbacterium sp. CFBP9023]MDY0982684.1 hypothetical protein [Microbacterium sp. CFBP9023]
MVTIRVKFVSWSSAVGENRAQDVELVGEADDLFADVILARIPSEESHAGHVDVRVPGTEAWTFAPIDRGVTMRQVHTFAGGEEITVSRVGRGGGGLMDTLSEWVGAGLTVVGIWDLLRQGHGALGAALYRSQRAEARRWLIVGTHTQPHLELTQWVKAHPSWAMTDVTRVFTLNVAEAATLLRASGYTPHDASGQYWHEITD